MRRPTASLEAMPASPAPVARPGRLDAVAIGFHVLVYGYACASLLRPVRAITATFADDSAYYLAIARNFVQGYGWTFDRIHPTNGFQPLWQYLLVALCWLVPGSPELQMRAEGVLESTLLVGAMGLLWRVVRRAAGPLAGVTFAAIFASVIFLPLRQGMESSLLLLVGAALLERSLDGPEALVSTAGRRAWTGLLLAALMLSRLDTVFWAGTLLVALGASRPRVGGSRWAPWGRATWTGCVAAVPVAAYLAYNRLAFGHVLPISGAIKSSFPVAGWYYSRFVLSPAGRLWFHTGILAAVATLVWASLRGRSIPSWFWRAAVPALGAAVLLHDLYAVLYLRWGVFSRHFVSSQLLACLLLPALAARTLERLPRPVGRWMWVVGVVALGTLGAAAIRERDWGNRSRTSWHGISYDAAVWVRSRLPRDAILAMTDCGYMGFFSGHRVVNLDGVVNGFAYQESLRVGHFRQFLAASRVGYLVSHSGGGEDVVRAVYDSVRFTAWSHLYDRPGGSIELHRGSEVYRSPPYREGGKTYAAVIWRLSGPSP